MGNDIPIVEWKDIKQFYKMITDKLFWKILKQEVTEPYEMMGQKITRRYSDYEHDPVSAELKNDRKKKRKQILQSMDIIEKSKLQVFGFLRFVMLIVNFMIIFLIILTHLVYGIININLSLFYIILWILSMLFVKSITKWAKKEQKIKEFLEA